MDGWMDILDVGGKMMMMRDDLYYGRVVNIIKHVRCVRNHQNVCCHQIVAFKHTIHIQEMCHKPFHVFMAIVFHSNKFCHAILVFPHAHNKHSAHRNTRRRWFRTENLLSQWPKYVCICIWIASVTHISFSVSITNTKTLWALHKTVCTFVCMRSALQELLALPLPFSNIRKTITTDNNRNRFFCTH